MRSSRWGGGRARRSALHGAVAALVAVLATVPVAAQQPRDAIDALLERGRFQEAAWAAQEAGDIARAEAILGRLRDILRSPPERARPLGMDSQGVSYTFRLEHGDGVSSIFKVDGSDIFCPHCGGDREVAAYRIDRLLGFDLTPMTVPTRVVVRGDTLTGSAMYFVHGGSTSLEVEAEKPDRLRLFDAIIGNSDRHPSNWLILPDGRVVAIDHNRAFQYRTLTRPETCWETEVDSIARPRSLGRPFRRYRSLADDSLRAAVAGLEPELATRFLSMRSRVVERVEARIRRPEARLSHSDCGAGL